MFIVNTVSGWMNKLMLIRSCGLWFLFLFLWHMVFVSRVFSCWGQRLLCSFVTVFLLFPLFIAQNMLVWSLYLPFYPCVVNLGFLSSVSTVEVDQIETTENGRHVCNLKIVHNHQLTWLWLFEDRIKLSTG